MVSSYKGTENNEQPKRLLLAFETSEEVQRFFIKGVFRTETALIDEMYNDEGHYYSKHFPKVFTGWESVYTTGKHVIESEERHEGNGDL